MSSNMLSIASSGIRTATKALDVTSSNIANASTEGYVRRSASIAEVSATSVLSTTATLSGARVAGITRNADSFRQSEVRRTGSDAARASSEVAGLTSVESALEDTGVYDSVVSFESALTSLKSDPTDSSLRANAVEQGRAMAQTFNTASQSLDAAATGLQTDAQSGVASVNDIAGQLAKLNTKLTRSAGSDQSALLDQRDLLLQQMSDKVDVTTTINADQSATVTLGASSSASSGSGASAGVALVSGGTASTLTMAQANDGTLSFAVGGQAVTPSGGALAGDALALGQLAQTRTRLDGIAASVISTVNDANENGVDSSGNTGQALFSGTGASDIAMAATSGTALATAAAGSGANSRDATNLTALQSALTSADPAGAVDTLLYDVSSAVASRTTTSDTLTTLSTNAKDALDAQAGVNLDDEAVNLTKYQQAYQASAKVIQAASDIFDSILSIN